MRLTDLGFRAWRAAASQPRSGGRWGSVGDQSRACSLERRARPLSIQANEKEAQRGQEGADRPPALTPDRLGGTDGKMTDEKGVPAELIGGRVTEDVVAIIHEGLFYQVGREEKEGEGALYLALHRRGNKIGEREGLGFGARPSTAPISVLEAPFFRGEKPHRENGRPKRLSGANTKAFLWRTRKEDLNRRCRLYGRARTRILLRGPAPVCAGRWPNKKNHLRTTKEISPFATFEAKPRWGHYPTLPSPITRGNAASTNTLTASSGLPSRFLPLYFF